MATRLFAPFLAVMLLSSAGLSGQTNRPAAERLTAVAVDLGGTLTARVSTAHVEITIDRWSSRAEQQRVSAALRGQGTDKLLDVMRDLRPVGRIQVDNNLGWDLRFAQVEQTGDGRKIVLATDRPVTFYEAWNASRISDYPFTFIELAVNGDGHGQGKLMPATRVTASGDGRFVFLEAYDQAVQLNDVKTERIRPLVRSR